MIFNSMVHWTDREKQWEVDIGGWYGILKSITISWFDLGLDDWSVYNVDIHVYKIDESFITKY